MSKFSVKKPYTVVVSVIIVLLLGGISFLNLETDLLPELDLPFIAIMTNYPGATPEEIETVITKPVEQSVATINNIKNVTSVSRENTSFVMLEFNNDANMDSSIIEINSNLDLIKGFWDDSVSSPMIIRINPDMLPVMISAIDIEGKDINEVSRIAREDIIPNLESITGVASVDSVGMVEENIEIILSEKKIENLNNKLLGEIDKEILDAKSELNKTKDEIEKGKQSLKSERTKQSNKINEGKNQINSGLSEMAKGLETIDTSIEELEEKKPLLEAAVVGINAAETEASKVLTELEKYLEENSEEIILAKGALDRVKEERVGLEASLSELNLGLETLKESKSELISQKSDLENKKNELISGERALNKELNKAEKELTEGSKKIEEGLITLEDKQEEAFKKSDLTGIITKDMIKGILMGQNFSMPAGYILEGGEDYVVKVGDKIEDLDALKNLFLFDTGVDGVGKIYLDSVSDIGINDNSDVIYAKVNGNNALMLNFQKQSGYSISEVSENIKDKVEDMKEDDSSISFTALMDQGEYINIVVDSVLRNIIYGGLLAVLVLIIFLKDAKPTVIISLSVPISIIFAIALMYFTGVSINIISLAGLALGVGMLVDNSIVVIENIYRYRNNGYSARDASILGAREVSGAITTSTITTASVFLPIVFVKGISRQIFTDMGLTIAYSLLASLIVALTLVPMMASVILKNIETKENRILDKIIQAYEKTLARSLNHKWLIVLVSFVLLVVSGFVAIGLGTSFIPEMEAPQMSLTVEKDEEETDAELIEKSDKMIDSLSSLEGIDTVGAFKTSSIGGAVMGGSSENIELYILLEEDRKSSNEEIEKNIRDIAENEDIEIEIHSSNMDMSQMGGSGIEIMIKGSDIEKLKLISRDIEDIVKSTEGTENIISDANDISNELNILVDKEKAMKNELTVASVYQIVSEKISANRKVTDINFNNKDYDVIIVEDKNEDISREELLNIVVKENEDEDEEDILLQDIADLKDREGLLRINRDSQERYVTVKSSIAPGYNIGLVSRDMESKLKDYKILDGYKIEVSGENEMIRDSLTDLFKMAALAIVLIYLIMVSQFQSLLSPFIIMFTIPLAFTGGIFMLYLTGNNISLIAMLGFLVLSGVVVNNGIVFVDYANQMIDEGNSLNEALIMTGKTRIRPILMTAITTILGLLTLAFGVGTGAEMLQPLAIVTIGGLLYATILTLFVVPSMYSIFNKRRIEKKEQTKVG